MKTDLVKNDRTVGMGDVLVFVLLRSVSKAYTGVCKLYAVAQLE